MARPCKQRRICAMPGCRKFGPMHGRPGGCAITMTLDEFESIRLIDLEGLNQEQCAAHMSVARTTVQAIYSSARAKLAQSLVNGWQLVIEGGDYLLCDGTETACDCPRRCVGKCPKANDNRGESTMKIAVTYENGQVFQHFGHTESFKFYEVTDGRVTAATVAGTNGSGHGALAGLLRGMGVDTLICGGIGGGARQALAQAGIRLYPGVTGEADKAVEALLNGTLQFNPDELCSHHGEHHHEGGCGSHGCGGQE